MYIGLYKSMIGTGDLLSHSKGLTQDQLDQLKELKLGDRIIVYQQTDKKSENTPDFVIRRYYRKEEREKKREQESL